MDWRIGSVEDSIIYESQCLQTSIVELSSSHHEHDHKEKCVEEAHNHSLALDIVVTAREGAMQDLKELGESLRKQSEEII